MGFMTTTNRQGREVYVCEAGYSGCKQYPCVAKRCAHGWCQKYYICENCRPEFSAKHKAKHDKGANDTCWQSMKRTEAEALDLKVNHADDYITLAAWGDWHDSVPPNYVGVFAGRGGRMENGAYPPDTKYFFVPADEYQKRERQFIIDTSRHIECKPIS